jgi:hypothetical protein
MTTARRRLLRLALESLELQRIAIEDEIRRVGTELKDLLRSRSAPPSPRARMRRKVRRP